MEESRRLADRREEEERGIHTVAKPPLLFSLSVLM